MLSESARAAESNSLQPSVPASAASRDIKSLAPVCDGGSPSSLTTVASTTSWPSARQRASSSSTLATDRNPAEHRPQDLDRARDLRVGGCVAGGQAQAAQCALHAQPHRQEDVRRVKRS